MVDYTIVFRVEESLNDRSMDSLLVQSDAMQWVKIHSCILSELKDNLMGLAIVERNGLVGLIDQENKILLPPLYKQIVFDDELIITHEAATNHNKQTIYSYKKNELKPIGDYEDSYFTKYGFKTVKRNSLWGCIEAATGYLVVPCKYDEFLEFRAHGYAVVKKGKHKGLVDKNGAEVLTCDYASIHSVIGDRIVLSNRYYAWGVIDFDQKEITPFIYDDVAGASVTGNLLLVRKEGKCGFVNILSGQEQIPCIYDDATPFDADKNIACVTQAGKSFWINTDGKPENPIKF